MSRDCPEPKADKESDASNINNLMLNAIEFDEDELEIAHVAND